MTQTLQVIANPWAAIDDQARPCGAVLMDLDEHNPHGGKYVGAKLVTVEISPKQWRKVGTAVETTQEARYDRRWQFSEQPQTVPAPKGSLTGYYRDRVVRGELLAADTRCAAAVGIKFVEPSKLIAAAKAARRAEFDAQHGNGAFDALQPAGETTAEPKRAAKPKS